MNNLQKITLIVGCTGVLTNITALLMNIEMLGYIALFLGRSSGFLYMVCLERFRPVYLFPTTISAINCFYNSEFLIFAELLASSAVYQYSALKTFQKHAA